MNFKELLGKVTPGVWVTSELDVLAKDAIETIVAHVTGAMSNPSAVADAQYIARLNPETMKLVHEALSEADDSAQGERPSIDAACISLRSLKKIRAALSALNRASPAP